MIRLIWSRYTFSEKSLKHFRSSKNLLPSWKLKETQRKCLRVTKKVNLTLKHVKNVCKQKGFNGELITSFNPHQNGIAERCFSTLFACTRAMLYDENLYNNQWGEAISTTVYLKNRSLTKLLKEIISYKFDTCDKANVNNLHRFDCVSYHHNKDP